MGGGKPLPLSWPSILREHSALLPRAPGPWLGSLTPGCPHITKEMLVNPNPIADGVLLTLREAWALYVPGIPLKSSEDRWGVESQRNIHLCLPAFLAHSVFPAEWIWWNLHMHDNHVRVRAKLAGQYAPRWPTSQWLFDPERMKKHYGWYAHAPDRRLGGLTTFTPEARAYGVAHQALQVELCSSPKMPSALRVQGAVRMNMGTLDAEALAEGALRQTIKLRDMAANWHFIWGT